MMWRRTDGPGGLFTLMAVLAICGWAVAWCAGQEAGAGTGAGTGAAPAEPGVPFLFVRAPKPVTIDGKLDEWVLSAPASYEVDANAQDRTVKTYGMWDDQNLYLAYVVRDASPMKNNGDDPSRAFKTGDSLHFYLSTSKDVAAKGSEGGPEDYHVMMAVLQGKPTVFAFRQKKTGVSKPLNIASPAQSINLDWMGPVPGAELAVALAPDGKGYTAEVKLPLAFFDHFQPQANQAVAADVAVNFSDAAGTTNLAKVWWHRGASQILDVPTELRFDRNLWGTGKFLAPGQRPLIIDNANLYVVPAPATVTMDGDLSAWDLSCAYGPQYVDPALKDKYNVTWAAMYDDQALYLGAVFNSGMPLKNDGGVNNVWWEGDALEFRLALDPAKQDGDPKQNLDILTLGVWYNPAEQKDYVALQRSFKFQISDTTGITVRSKATPTGRTFEVRVPWSMVKSGHHPKAGDSVACTLAAIWEHGLRAYGMGSISSFRGMDNWGQAHFLEAGHQPLVYRNLHMPVAGEPALDAGKYQATVTVAKKGLLSAGVYAADGTLLRTLFAGRAVNPGAVQVGWDGKDDAGHELPPGPYQVRAAANAGMKALFVTSVTSPGQPPYASPDPKRGWGGVWGNVVDLAADPSGVYPLWALEEGDGALLHTDEDGNLIWRQHIPLALPGAQAALASNGKYVFVGVDSAGKNAGANTGHAGLWRVRCADGRYAPFATESSDPLEFYLSGVSKPDAVVPAAGAPAKTPAAVGGMAADAKTLYVAAFYQDAIASFDAESGQPLKTIAVKAPRGICFDGPDALLVISAKQVVRVDLASGQTTPVVTGGLEAPWHVAVDGQGMILVTDRGASQQVKRFDRQGKLAGSYGQPGGRDNNGPYSPDRLRAPAGVAVAASGKVFVSEDAPPRVFLRLGGDLQYEKLWAGPWYLSGEVTVDPENPQYIYMWSHDAFIRHVVDYEKKTSRPDAVWSDFALPIGSYARWYPRIVHHDGQTYMFCGGTNASVYRIDGAKMLLIAAVGTDPKNKAQPMWAFTDRNENGVLDEGEKVSFAAAGAKAIYRGSYSGGSLDDRDLSLYLLSAEDQILVLTPTFLKPGVPVYSFDNLRVIPLAAAKKPGVKAHPSSIWQAPDGGIFGNAQVDGSDPRGIGHSSHLADVYAYRLDHDGKLVWRAGQKASGIAKNGEFYGRACGLGGPIAGAYFDFVDENGQDKVYTQDGLFVGNLLDDTATAAPSEYTLFVEHFGSIVYQNARDGRWYFVAGASGYASIWEIVGLDQVSRMQASIEVK